MEYGPPFDDSPSPPDFEFDTEGSALDPVNFDDGDGPVGMLIADIQIEGVYEIIENGPGFTEQYRAERERESGGTAEVDEPPAAEVRIEAWVEEDVWQQFNDLREREDPFPVAVGPFTFELMGIANLSKRKSGEQPGAFHMTMQLKEFREVVVQRRELGDVLGGGGAAAGPGDSPDGVVGPMAAWTDDGTGRDARTGEPIPDMRRIPVPNGARPVHSVPGGTAWGRVLFIAGGPNAHPIVSPSGGGWSVQDVGLDGPSHSRNRDTFMGLTANGNTGLVDNVYIGHGTNHPRGTGMWYDNGSSAPLIVRHSNIQHWLDNGIYGSAPRSGNARVLYENCYGYQNEVSTYRLNEGTIRNCVAYHDSSHSGRGNRGIWGWTGGPILVENSNIRVDTGHAIIARGSSSIQVRGGGLTGNTSGNVNVSGAGPANVNAFHSAIPGSPLDAAAGRGGPS